MELRAPRPGMLPQASSAVGGGTKLPAGKLIAPDPSFASGPSGPVLWISAQPVARAGALWREVASGFADHGLWPLVLDSLHGADDRPWLAGELDPSQSSSPEEHDVAAVLEELWSQVVPVEEEDPEAFAPLAPFGREFPGLAPASLEADDTDALTSVVASLEGRLGLVAVTRPADAVAALGWSGPVNHFGDMGILSAVLRSWEDRFGAFLVGVGFDTMTVAVQRPPRTIDRAFAVAAEHFAMCSDNIHQGAGSIEEYASALVDRPAWTFWWD
jgi:hypothetical protein